MSHKYNRLVAKTQQTIVFVEEIQQVSLEAQGQPVFERLCLSTRYIRVEKNNVSETKINYYWGSNIITRVRDNRPNMGEFGTLSVFFHIMKLFKKSHNFSCIYDYN